VSKTERSSIKQQKPCLIWFTGLSASGKSTVANIVERKLYEMNRHTYLLDGDNVRHGLCGDLKFSVEDRVENIRRIGELGKLFLDGGIITLCAFISPFISDRKIVRELLLTHEFIEVYMNTSLQECERRDPKGLYIKARAGDIKLFTGIDSPYEAPLNPEIHLDGDNNTAERCAAQVIEYLDANDYLSNS
jgi:adenylyl-sulfate kinase